MQHSLFALALLVPDYDQAIDFYTRVLGFRLIEDRPMGPDKRWVLVAPSGQGGESAAGAGRHSAAGRRNWQPDWWSGVPLPAHR